MEGPLPRVGNQESFLIPAKSTELAQVDSYTISRESWLRYYADNRIDSLLARLSL